MRPTISELAFTPDVLRDSSIESQGVEVDSNLEVVRITTRQYVTYEATLDDSDLGAVVRSVLSGAESEGVALVSSGDPEDRRVRIYPDGMRVTSSAAEFVRIHSDPPTGVVESEVVGGLTEGRMSVPGPNGQQRPRSDFLRDDERRYFPLEVNDSGHVTGMTLRSTDELSVLTPIGRSEDRPFVISNEIVVLGDEPLAQRLKDVGGKPAEGEILRYAVTGRRGDPPEMQILGGNYHKDFNDKMQAESRLHRVGQQGPETVMVDLDFSGVEKRIAEGLARKGDRRFWPLAYASGPQRLMDSVASWSRKPPEEVYAEWRKIYDPLMQDLAKWKSEVMARTDDSSDFDRVAQGLVEAANLQRWRTLILQMNARTPPGQSPWVTLQQIDQELRELRGLRGLPRVYDDSTDAREKLRVDRLDRVIGRIEEDRERVMTMVESWSQESSRKIAEAIAEQLELKRFELHNAELALQYPYRSSLNSGESIVKIRARLDQCRAVVRTLLRDVERLEIEYKKADDERRFLAQGFPGGRIHESDEAEA